ncbi:carboxylesterase/lipase family protein [Aestuariimicrobium ganziense]|uniref:carboxylesterase/lipase family protein n=1 Tax=Aestuariimicrobium ganziense TaxID=2773677 RepID=UPI0019409398|nr:carboxylesterase family protein [Aestuariimicrobium ganziense]
MSNFSRRSVLVAGAVAAGAGLTNVRPAQAAPGQNPGKKGVRMTPAVKVTGGVVRGYVDDNGVKTFKGIRYAASTHGPNRWRAPQPVPRWTGIKETTAFGPIAVQNPAFAPFGPWTWEYLDTNMTLENGLMSEDCLSLNVWTTANPNARRPVIVYIHGGANTSGSGGNEVYTGEKIVHKGVVYVTINYRVGIFGFLAHKDSTGNEVTGNFAIMDMIAALRWVRDNIRAFGGDPGNVTVAGQSAGSMDIQTLIASPAAAGLFHRAMTMSANSIDSPVSTLAQAQARASQSFGSLTLEHLRALSSAQVQALTASYNPSSPVIDGQVVTHSLTDAYLSGTANRVDLMIGNVNGDEVLFGPLRLPGGSPLPIGQVQSVTPAVFEDAVRQQFGAHFVDLYPVDPGAANVIETARQLNADAMVARAARQGDVRARHYADRTTLIYQFAHDVPDTPERMAAYGAFHTGDVGYWLNYFSDTWHRPWTAVDHRLGDVMSDHLVAFATRGSVPGWPAHVAGAPADRYMHYTDTASPSVLDQARTAAWEAYWAR